MAIVYIIYDLCTHGCTHSLGGVNLGEAVVCALAKELPQSANLQWLQ